MQASLGYKPLWVPSLKEYEKESLTCLHLIKFIFKKNAANVLLNFY